jgi:hypothetical protein
LKEIKESKIYKDQYGTWENYLKERWGYSEGHYYRLQQAIKVNESLHIVETLPLNLKQVEQLAPLEPEQQIEVWETVTERYDPKEITAAKIKEVKQEILEPEVEKALEENVNPVYDALSQVYKQAINEKVKQSFCEWLSLYVESFK